MNRLLLIVLLVISARVVALAQSWRGEVQSGIGVYAMDELKAYQKENTQIIKVVQDFPAWIYYRGFFTVSPLKNKRWRTGLAYTYLTTGARNDYQDYSGTLRMDMVVHAHCPGIINSYEWSFGRVSVSPNLIVSRSFATYTEKRQFRLTAQDVVNTSHAKFESGNLLFDGFVQGTFSVGDFRPTLLVGYCYDLKSDLKSDDEYPTTLSTDWSGLRAGISLAYVF